MKVFLDLDGTLLDVSDRNYTVYREVTLHFGGKPMDKQEYWNLKRNKTKWDTLLPLSDLSISIEQAYLREFITKIEAESYLKLDKLFPDSIKVLQTLQSQHECYLVSLRRNHENLIAELDWLNLSPYFKVILTGHSESDGYDVKISLIKQHLGSNTGVIIGDTEADILAGKELGLTTVALTSGIRDVLFLTALEPDFVFNSVSEVVTSEALRL